MRTNGEIGHRDEKGGPQIQNQLLPLFENQKASRNNGIKIREGSRDHHHGRTPVPRFAA